MNPLEQIGRLAVEADKARKKFDAEPNAQVRFAFNKAYHDANDAFTKAIAAYDASKPADDLDDDSQNKLEKVLSNSKTVFQLSAFGKLSYDQTECMLKEAFRAGQSSSAHFNRLEWLESKMPMVSIWDGEKFIALYSSTMSNVASLTEAIDAAMKGKQ